MQTKKHYIHANLTTNTHIHTDTFAYTHELCEWDEVHWKSIEGEEEQTNRSVIKMGRIFLEHLGGLKLFNCAECHTNLTNRSQLISTRFTGATGEFSKCEIMYHLHNLYLLSPYRTCLSLQACRQLDLQCNSGKGDAHWPPHGARCHVQELWGQARLDVRIRNRWDAEVSTHHTTPYSSTVHGTGTEYRITVGFPLTLDLSLSLSIYL